LSSGPEVSTDVESMTRAAIEGLFDRFDGSIWVEVKLNRSHGHSPPEAREGPWRQARQHMLLATANKLQGGQDGAQ